MLEMKTYSSMNVNILLHGLAEVVSVFLVQMPMKLGIAAVIAIGASEAHAIPAPANLKILQRASQCRQLFYQYPDAGSAAQPIGKIEVNAMAEKDLGAGIGRDARIIARIASELGLAVPPHQLNIAPSGQLDVLATMGGHSSPHWYDGAKVMDSASSHGILEFVTAGCPTCRSYYSASTPMEEQRSVVMHVAGHNDMSGTSYYQRLRPMDGPLASHQLAQLVGKAYREHGHDEVALHYQYLQSFGYLQDYIHGTFDDPAKFTQQNMNTPLAKPPVKSFWDKVGELQDDGGFFGRLGDRDHSTDAGYSGAGKTNSTKGASKQASNQWTRTPGVLQAMTEMTPVDAKEWQSSMLKLYEQVQRPYPSIFQTKIMNEGWATLMMYIIARHAPWTDSADLVKYGQLISGVAGRMDLKNPYWLGVSGWINLYEQYSMRPEIKDLGAFEKDRRFIKWAREMYAKKNDSEWAKVALDQRWIEKHRFMLFRQTLPDEMDPNIPQEKQQYIVLSRNWKRLQNYIISRYVNIKLLQLPSFTLQNPADSQGYFVLRQEGRENKLAIEMASAAKTLFVISQVMKKPARLEALFDRPVQYNRPGRFTRIDGLPFVPPDIAGDPRSQAASPDVSMGRMTVDVNGRLKFVWLEGEASEGWNKGLEATLEKKINEYKHDVLASYNDSLSEMQMKKWEILAAKVSDANSHGIDALVDYAPHAGASIREYLHIIEARLMSELRKMLAGKSKGRVTSSGVKLPVLPEVPQFGYSRNSLGRLERSHPPGRVDHVGYLPDLDFNADTFSSNVTPGQLMPGDKFGNKQQKKNGQGEGEGEEGDPSDEQADQQQDGEPKDGQTPVPGGGKGGDTPSEIKIPLELYGELLAEMLELPNLRRTTGGVSQTSSIRRGHRTKPSGNTLWDDTMVAAIEKARAIRRGEGRPYDSSVPMMDLVREALKLLEPSDIVVSGRMEKQLPDTEAVLVVNVDLTASMAGERIAIAKNLVYNAKALLMAKYKNVTIRYVGFDSTARELTERQIFSQFFGGGTNYTSAIKKDREILNQYENSRFNKYVLTIGDGETSQQDASQYTQELSDLSVDLQYAGLAITNEQLSEYTAAIVSEHKKLQESWPWVGIAHLRTRADMMQALKDLFPKGQGPQ
jgi:uncharacterized sporulation protein YeaH/YhbH (DUF444 family)/spore cortex formation protein SpoVR/YcgB (stage V sporulation)